MVGKTVGHFQILEKIGSGGMGDVWLADDTRLERKVALKFLPSEVATEEEQTRFIREAKAASALDHPNICTIHEVDETDSGQTYIAMAYCDGETVKKQIGRGPLKLNDALDIAIQTAGGLARAHKEGIVHRDIKPANVIVTEDGLVKIVDFGLAKLAGTTQLTKTGSSMGTVAYMSPEQVQGEDVDRRADIWSLGVMLYEMVVGRQPFESDHEQGIVYSILNDEPEPITAQRARLPIELERIVQKMLAKNSAERFQTVEDLLVDLKAVQRDSETGIVPETGTSTAARTDSRKSIRALAGIALSVIGITAIYLLVLAPGAGRIPRVAVLPFENIGSADIKYNASAMSGSITSRLSGLQGMTTLPDISPALYVNTEKLPRQIGRELGADYLLRGTTQWEQSGGNTRVEVTVHLIRVSEGIEVWSDIYTSDFTGIFEIQGAIAEQIVSALNREILLEKKQIIPRQPSDNTAADMAYNRGQYFMSLPHFIEENWNLGLVALTQAVELDSTFALAWAALSTNHAKMIYFMMDASPERYEMARLAAERAVELAPDSPEVELALALYHLWAYRDTQEAEAHLKLAERGLRGDYRVPNARGMIHQVLGRWEESVVSFEDALRLKPNDGAIWTNISWGHWMLRNYSQALEASNQAINLAPDQMWPYLYKCFVLWSWEGKDAVEKTRITLEAVPGGNDWLKFCWFYQLLGEGRYQEALDYINELPGDWIITKQFTFPKAYFKAALFKSLGQFDTAAAELELARVQLTQRVEEYPYDYRYHSQLGIVLAFLGQKEEAIREGLVAKELLPLEKDRFYGQTPLFDLAEIYAALDEPDAALDIIEQLFSMPSMFSVKFLEVYTNFESLKEHPRYKELMQKYK